MAWSQSSEHVTLAEVDTEISQVALMKASNLGDVTSPSTARSNIGTDALTAARPPKIGGVCYVDLFYGNDATAARSGSPF